MTALIGRREFITFVVARRRRGRWRRGRSSPDRIPRIAVLTGADPTETDGPTMAHF